MKYSKTYLFFMILLFLGSSIGLIATHEEIHVAVYKSYGIESNVEWFSHFPWRVVTVAEETCPSDMCRYAQDLNEIVFYYLQAFYSIFFFIYIIYIIRNLETKKEKEINKKNEEIMEELRRMQ